MNNRKRTRGRKIQAIKVPEMIYEKVNLKTIGALKPAKLVPNPHPHAGKTIFVRHIN